MEQEGAEIVSIPYEREGISKATHAEPVAKVLKKFQFPTNGKAYPKQVNYAQDSGAWALFQFPTNGKAYPKWARGCPSAYRSSFLVSIPYEREGISKGVKVLRRTGRASRFNSLRTGRHIQRLTILIGLIVLLVLSFNSLRTGRHIQSLTLNKILAARSCVSIPYEREGISKDVGSETELKIKNTTFQFPTNGKAYPKRTIEEVTKGVAKGFQFPTNGKAYPKNICQKDSHR